MPYIMIIVSLLAADSIIKWLVEKQKNIDGTLRIGKRIVIKRYHNRGAMLNLGDKKQYFIALLSLVFSAFVTGIFVATLGKKGKRLLKTGLALILGGAYSNTYDRLRRKYVVDYFSMSLFNQQNLDQKKYSGRLLRKVDAKFSSIVFNLADFGIIIGAMLMMISELGSE